MLFRRIGEFELDKPFEKESKVKRGGELSVMSRSCEIIKLGSKIKQNLKAIIEEVLTAQTGSVSETLKLLIKWNFKLLKMNEK